jgi:DNA-binding transcriptional MerR regulator
MKAKLFSTSEAAAKIGVSRQTLYTWIDVGLVQAPEPLRDGVRLWTASQIAAAAKAKGKLRRGPVPMKRGGK